jgi:prepilin-type N-terminal cleavage/methylation domain-containing protein
MKVFRKVKGFTLVEIMIVVAIIGIIIAIAVPGFIRARSQSRMRNCQENLTKIDGAKEQMALEANLAPGAAVTMAQLTDSDSGNGYLKKEPKEPSGGTYAVGNIGVDPTCSTGYPGHSLAEIGDVITDVEGGS